MCGGGGKKQDLPPAVDPAEERAKADEEATVKANSKAAADKLRRQKQSLLASGAQGNAAQGQTMSVMAQGKPTLGS